ncbi:MULTISPECIES: hypothetical protein [Cetobacterium]|jgi:hypothetical protein|uniref:Uncharacterized protein n=1 Tax=Candidatus Cetobacterium colombiensis TaxID=3073100 RepID=A0ABU4WFK1_9FUSO|nr:hypothetical protein [Candidatus Cetobacterium colombiensis]MDX8337326.1 hypothetical protein [Candidatus Cetobacterium colombiensis]
MTSKKLSVLDRLKQDSFKKKESIPKESISSKEFEITVVEKDFILENDIIFNYDDIHDLEMKKDLLNYETRLNIAKNNYHTKAGEILFEANEKYANNKNGTFGIWLDYMKIGKKSAERLVNRFKFINNNCLTLEEKTYFETLPLSLTYEISSPNANEELINAVMNKQIKTRKEYITLKNTLKNNISKNSNLGSIEKLFNKLNLNISNLIETKIESSSLDSNKAKSVYERIELLNKEIKTLLNEIEKLD